MPDLQAQFAHALLSPDAPVPDGMTTIDGGPADHRLAIYRNNVLVGLIDALCDAFPVIERLTGEEFFRATAAEFVRTQPPVSPVLLMYGSDFAQFLAAFFPPAAAVAYLADIARLEFAWIEAFHAAEQDPIDPTVFNAIPPQALDETRLEMHPSLRLVGSSWPIISIWEANRDPRTQPHVELPGHPQNALICRPAADVEVRRLPAGGLEFVDALQRGDALQAAALKGAAASDSFDLTDNLVGLLQSGAVTGLIAPQVQQFPADGETG